MQPKISLPSDSVLSRISQYLQRLQSADSPLEKLEYLLAAIAVIFNAVRIIKYVIIKSPGFDDLFYFIFRWKPDSYRRARRRPSSWGPTTSCRCSSGCWWRRTLWRPKSRLSTCGVCCTLLFSPGREVII